MSERTHTKSPPLPIPPADGPVLSVRLRDDVAWERPGGGRITLVRNGRRFPDMPAAPLIESLAGAWMTEASIDRLAESAADPAAVYFVCARLFSLGLLKARCTAGGRPLFSLVPAPEWQAWQGSVPAEAPGLSALACLRRDGRDLVLEMPLARRRCIIHDKECLAWLMEALREDARRDRTAGDAALTAGDPARAAFYRALSLMDAAAYDEPAGRSAWEFHDLLFFHHSSLGFHDDPAGATWPPDRGRQPEPPFKPCTGACVPLPEPDEGLTVKLRAPFAEVLAGRRTGRIPGNRPITVEELGALLGASARVREVRDDPFHPGSRISLRPSPSGGALHSLEIYPLVRVCTGLPAGVWRYDPEGHRLESVAAHGASLDAYLTRNPHAPALDAGLPHIRLLITSRILRNSQKYEKIAYRLVLQDLGCLYQTLSLTAAALGLASCIIGTVDARRLGAIMGLEPLVEPVIGEILLSSR